MQYREIPGTGIKISEVTLGTWVFGGVNWGPADEKTCLDTVAKALDCGINSIDTAPAYGWGRAEELVGKAVKGRREKVFIATKCGIVQSGAGMQICLAPESIRSEVVVSLSKLGTDFIDLYQLHWPDPRVRLEDTLGEMQRLKEEGKIRNIGVCNFNDTLLAKALEISPIVSVQNEYSFLKRDSAENGVLDICAAKGVAFLAYGPLSGGVLSGKYKTPPQLKKDDARRFFYKHYGEKTFSKAASAALKLEAVARQHSKTAAQAAINWVLANPSVVSVLSGARTPEQIEDNAGASDWKLDRPELDALSDFEN